MAKYKLTQKAVADLNEIWEYTFFKWSEQQADKYYNLLLKDCQNLANNPNFGKNYKGVRKDLLGQISNKHIIFYRVIKEGIIEITRILHSKMDIKNRLKE